MPQNISSLDPVQLSPLTVCRHRWASVLTPLIIEQGSPLGTTQTSESSSRDSNRIFAGNLLSPPMLPGRGKTRAPLASSNSLLAHRPRGQTNLFPIVYHKSVPVEFPSSHSIKSSVKLPPNHSNVLSPTSNLVYRQHDLSVPSELPPFSPIQSPIHSPTPPLQKNRPATQRTFPRNPTRPLKRQNSDTYNDLRSDPDDEWSTLPVRKKVKAEPCAEMISLLFNLY
ncbi:hypothetical protein B0H10DRAFT_1019507 [Mycena sp. CBHHK59/15]|nr:hypothetical protein B0H10DRAFT_1019507 [Mycena sp. CBHHK59/15]